MSVPFLSRYGAASRDPSPVNRMMAQVASDFRDEIDINLGVGYVNEATIPRQAIAAALQAVVSDPVTHRLALNYGGPEGSPTLVAALRRFLARRRVAPLSDAVLAGRRIIVGANGATSLLESFGQLFAPGIVVTSDPRYYIYCELLERLGHRVMAIPEGPAGLEAEAVRRRLDGLGQDVEAVRFLYLVTVNNPTGTICGNEHRRAFVSLAAELSERLGRSVPAILDLAYDDLIHDPTVPPPQSMLAESGASVYEIGTLSKIIAPGLRVGYLVGPDDSLTDALVQRVSDIGFSAPLVNQEIAARLLDSTADAQIEAVNAGYRTKSIQVRRWIEELFGDEVAAVSGGGGGFYYYLTLRTTRTDPESSLFRFVTRTTGDPAVDGRDGAVAPRVVYIPGSYCVQPDGELVEIGRRQLRISYGFEELPRIRSALEVIRDGMLWSAAGSAAAATSGAPGRGLGRPQP